MTHGDKNTLTFNGRPIGATEVHAQDGRGLRTYCHGVTDESTFETRFPGPHSIDIATCENAIVVTFRGLKDATQSVALELPIREWASTIRTREQRVSEYDRIFEEYKRSECSVDDLEQTSVKRRHHHDASASQLQEDARRAGIKMDHEAARDLFAVVAGVTSEMVGARGTGIGGHGTA